MNMARLVLNGKLLESWVADQGIRLRYRNDSASSLNGAAESHAVALDSEHLVPEYLFARSCEDTPGVLQEYVELPETRLSSPGDHSTAGTGGSRDDSAWKASQLLRLIARVWYLSRLGIGVEAGEALVASRIMHSRIRSMLGDLVGSPELFRSFLWGYLSSFRAPPVEHLLGVLSGRKRANLEDPLQALLAASELRLDGDIAHSLWKTIEAELEGALSAGGRPAAVLGMQHHHWREKVLNPILELDAEERTRRLVGGGASSERCGSARSRLEAISIVARREPDNAYDPSAIAVYDQSDMTRMGYLRSRLSYFLSRMMRDGELLHGHIVAVPLAEGTEGNLIVRLKRGVG